MKESRAAQGSVRGQNAKALCACSISVRAVGHNNTAAIVAKQERDKSKTSVGSGRRTLVSDAGGGRSAD